MMSSLVAWWLSCVSPPPEVADHEVWVVVARRDLWPGVPITEEDVYLQAVPAAMAVPDTLRDPTEVLDRMPRERILAQEPLREPRLARQGPGDHTLDPGVNTQVKRGMRAMIVRIRGAAHLPLDRSWPIEGGPHVRVFEVLEVDDDGVAQVLLHVTADQAEKLAHLGPEPLRLEGARVLQAQLSGPVAPSAGAYVQPGDIPVVVVDVGAASPQGIHEVRVVPVRRGEPRDRLATLDLAGIYTLEHAEGPRFHWDHHGGCLDLEELRRKTGYR